MAAIEIPFTPSIGEYRFATVIGSTSYTFDVRWNSRDSVIDENGVEVVRGAWYFDVREADGTVVVIGIKVVLGVYLGRRSNHPLFANGVMVAVDLSGNEREATFDDLGTRVAIQYIPVLDLIVRLQALPAS